MARAARFYERLGFVKSPVSVDSTAFMQLGPVVLSLFGRAALGEDANAGAIWNGNGGITLAHNVRSEAEVDAVLAEAEAAGAQILKPAQRASWGGYHGYFADPDGHIWEAAFNPFFDLDAGGAVKLPV